MNKCFCDVCHKAINEKEFKVKTCENYILLEDIKHHFAIKYEVISTTYGNMYELDTDLCVACVRKIFAMGKVAHKTKDADDLTHITPMQGYNKI